MGQSRQDERRGRGGNQPPRFQGPTESDLRKILVDGDVGLLVQWSDQVGKALADQGLSTNQIRNVFGTVRQIQLRWDKPGGSAEAQAFRDAVLLRPKLAYFAEREKKSKGGDRSTVGMETLQKVLDPALQIVSEGNQPRRERFERFAEFFEAIVAYHKSYGGK